jgi:hypothetical protein
MSSIDASRFLSIKLKIQRTNAQPGSPQANIKPPMAHKPVVDNAQWWNWKYSTVKAPPPMLETTVLINPTAHSRVVRGGVINMVTTAASVAPLAAASALPLMAL